MFTLPSEGPDDPRAVMARLIDTCPEFETLRIAEADIAIYMRLEAKSRGGKAILGTLALPGWQGALGPLAAWLLAEHHGKMPDFLMILDAEWWERASARDREALVFHELMHADQARDKEGELRFTSEGLPVWAIREHDVTAFHAEVRRYGPWHDDLREMQAALRDNRLA